MREKSRAFYVAMNSLEKKELLIASVTPSNLERGVLWFSENNEKIKHARVHNLWWQKNTITIEKDFAIKPSDLSRRILDLGYERAHTVYGPGGFAVHGGIIEIWPINEEKPCMIEFLGNIIVTIFVRQEITRDETIKPKLARGIETMIPESFVVHEDHGIGIFKGFFQNGELRSFLPTSDVASNAYFLVEYAPQAPGREPDRLYVPAEKKNRLTPYVGFETPTIHRLGGTIWFTTKRKVREDAEKLARALLALYAKREQVIRTPHFGDAALESKLRDTFPFVETEDQLRAEEEIMRDLRSPRPMDRVLCGDVGFGKTEVAIRAALRVIASGKQVAILAPTTILAAQHLNTFSERFKDLPVCVAMISRLTSKQETRQVIEELNGGTIDCIVGTHRLLSSDISFRNLGLVVIDEEQRFGVKQKEKMKELRVNADILSLSATPIPRTLSLTLAHLRNISQINTPLPDRLPTQTFVLPYGRSLVRDAIAQEIKRRGQIYFLHNRIETLGRVKEKLEKICKSKTKKLPLIGIIHGRMKEKEVLRTMSQFRAQKLDILVATTIIENGLDISNVNTLIVDDATRLGLAEAHQLRGRIGRGNTQAFAYFLYPARILKKTLTNKTISYNQKVSLPGSRAFERLRVLQEYASLGSGYEIALRDLEIRGAGNILGKEQSGAINKVGLNLYYQMLADAIEILKLDTPENPCSKTEQGNYL